MREKAYVHQSVRAIVLTVRVVVLVELKARGGWLVQNDKDSLQVKSDRSPRCLSSMVFMTAATKAR